MVENRNKYDWSYHIQEHKISGLSVKEYCMRAGISSWSFYDNRKKLLKSGIKSLDKVKFKSSEKNIIPIGSLYPDNGLTVYFGDGIKLEFRGHQDKDQLRIIFETLHNIGIERTC